MGIIICQFLNIFPHVYHGGTTYGAKGPTALESVDTRYFLQTQQTPFYYACLKNGPKFYMDEYVVPLNAIPALFYILYLVRLSSKLSYSRLRRLIANADIKRFKIVQDTPFEQ